MENFETQCGSNALLQQEKGMKGILKDVMIELEKLEAFLDAIVMIAVDQTDKTGSVIYTFASEGAIICSKVHETIDETELKLNNLSNDSVFITESGI